MNEKQFKPFIVGFVRVNVITAVFLAGAIGGVCGLIGQRIANAYVKRRP